MPLLAKKPTQRPFEIKNKSATKAEIVLYGAIGASWFEDSISAAQFSEELKKLDSTVNEITLRINSPGGDVFDGITIYNRLKQHKAKVIVHIDGLAASIASIIALAGDEIIMGEGALYMVHLPWTFGMGNRKDFDTLTARLMDVEEQLISIYAKKTKKSRSDIRKLLEDETWMDSAQAIEEGFVDSKAGETVAIAASVMTFANQWIKKTPKVKTEVIEAKEKIAALKANIDKFLVKK